jgi:biopolymer transport protein ExbD
MPLRDQYRSESPLNPNLIPLLDVVLQLITFFMILVHFGTKLEGATKEIRLPVAPAALPGSDLSLDRLIVVLDAQGRLLVPGGPPRDEAAARSWWSEQAELRRSGQETLGGPVAELPTAVILRADRRASYGAVRRTLAEAQQRGFVHFSLVVLRRPDQ